jgi:hypothetical protein
MFFEKHIYRLSCLTHCDIKSLLLRFIQVIDGRLVCYIAFQVEKVNCAFYWFHHVYDQEFTTIKVRR